MTSSMAAVEHNPAQLSSKVQTVYRSSSNARCTGSIATKVTLAAVFRQITNIGGRVSRPATMADVDVRPPILKNQLKNSKGRPRAYPFFMKIGYLGGLDRKVLTF